jgi:hypothetical protein
MRSLSPLAITLLVLAPLVVWRVYARTRRMVGRQRLTRIRPWIPLAIFPTVIALLGLATLARPTLLVWLAGGLGMGVLLGRFGLRKTRWEATPEGLYYTPNVHLGIALSLLLVGRVAYRLWELHGIDPTVPHGAADVTQSWATLAVFGVLAGYYVSYALGLLRWRRRLLRELPAPGAGGGGAEGVL